MDYRPRILDNYPNQRHFLQLVNIPVFGAPFLYMKNHKAACTTVLATLMANLLDQKGEGTGSIDMNTVHTPPNTLLLTGPRGLKMAQVLEALADRRVYRFTIIREPVARTVSSFADKIVKGDKQKTKLMRYLKRPVNSDMSLSQFLDIMAQDPGARDVDRHWRSQRLEVSYDFINYDFVGDMADLDGALNRIVRHIFKVDRPQVQDTRTSLGHKSKSAELIEGMTPSDRRNIETAFGPDFEMYHDVRQKLSQAA
ncbi:sulfotransferase family 2 domain-containing protein [Shimia abyssi]|uniref:Sulfotransferase family protein n=1 Tax=Shimia abyssi TaxID=1662395 RepID=A0A2P8FBP2_9RHOB|nr:sulfotransferase family 2 domain-containing protein [Shimia abyssi]PSL19145.1 sulfotransferase family protein [Shimia abyssi]